MTPLYHEWERGDILYWTSFDDNDANLEGYHVILNAVAMGVSEETTRLDKADGSGFLLDQYWVFNTVRLGSYQEIQTIDNITSEFVNNAVKTDNWTKNPNIINEVDGEFYKHIELIDIPDDAPPFVVYTDTARKMNDEQIKTFKEEYALAVAKRDADRKNQIYDDDDDDEDNDVEMNVEEVETFKAEYVLAVQKSIAGKKQKTYRWKTMNDFLNDPNGGNGVRTPTDAEEEEIENLDDWGPSDDEYDNSERKDPVDGPGKDKDDAINLLSSEDEDDN